MGGLALSETAIRHLGVFATQQEAAAYAERVAPLHEGKVLYARYVIGYRRHSDEFLDYP